MPDINDFKEAVADYMAYKLKQQLEADGASKDKTDFMLLGFDRYKKK